MNDKVDIGGFDTRLDLLKPVVRRTSIGSVERNWEPAGHVYAAVQTGKATEEAGTEVRLVETLEATTYAVPGLDHTWRASKGGNLYEILSFEVVERRYMRLTLGLLPGTTDVVIND